MTLNLGLNWPTALVGSVVVLVAGTLYIGLGWRNAPRARRALWIVAITFSLIGGVFGAVATRLFEAHTKGVNGG